MPGGLVVRDADGPEDTATVLQVLAKRARSLPRPFPGSHTHKLTPCILDRQFVAVLYTSESGATYRYTDEGDVVELCKWTVDLGTLPTFQQQASVSNGQGFYTNFELGLAVDSAGTS